MRRALVWLLAFWSGPLAAAPVPKERAEAEKVVGTWKMTLDSRGSTDTDLELDFYQSGKMVIRQKLQNGPPLVYEGNYHVAGSELPYEVARGGAVKKETLTIKKLTADELTLIDPDGLKEEFARVKKKDDPKK